MIEIDSELLQLLERRIPHFQSHLKGAKEYAPAVEDPEKEAAKCWRKIAKIDVDVIIIYGVGLGHLYHESLKWLSEDKKRFLVFIEDDPALLLKLAKTKYGKAMLKDKRVDLFFWENPLALEPLLKKIAWKYLFLKSSFALNKKEEYSQIASLFSSIQHGVHLVASDYSDFGIKLFENVYRNLLQTKNLRLASSLQQCFNNLPAIICGAGPSLKRNGHLLKELGGKALIFAGGSALNVLASLSVKPSFAGAIDKEAPHEVFKMNAAFEVPFFYQSRIFCENLSLVHSKRLLAADNGAYPLEKWLEEKLLPQGESLDAGWNVANFLTRMAILLGCSPIIFVGMDLAYEGGKSYAEGSGLKEKPKDDGLIEVRDMNGKPVLTQRDWLMSSEWVASIAKQETGRFINCSEGGLGFGSCVPNVPLQEVMKNLSLDYDLDGIVRQALLQVKPAHLDPAITLNWIQEIEKSLKLCDFHCDQGLLELESRFEDKAEFSPSVIEDTFMEEIAYTELLRPLWDVWKHVFIREMAILGEADSFRILMNELLFFKQAINEHTKLIRGLMHEL